MATIFPQSSRVPTLLSAILYVGVAFLLVAGFPQTLRALALRATPPAVTVVPGVNQKVPLLYTGIDFDIVNYTSTSPRGRFETSDGRVLGTVNKTVSIPVVNAVPSTARESLTIPVGIIAEALKHNRRFFYRRVFSDYVSAPVHVEVALTIVPPSGGTFSLVRMELAFNQPLQVAGTRPSSGGRITVPRFAKGLQGTATLTYNGGGTLRAQWKVDGQILSSVTQQLNPGLREIMINSPLTPSLPTYGTGLHKVTFEILDPVPAFDEPTIYYFVTESYTGAPLGSLTLTNPGEQEHVTLSLKALPRFSWQPAGEEILYRFQLYRLDDTLTFDPTVPMRFAYQKPVLAAMTRQTAYDLTEFNMKDIAADAPYCWQVQAFDADKMVAASMYRLVFFTGSAARNE
jgi:hypothetical protein